jgi:two-component system sensor histidine kinase UhpB
VPWTSLLDAASRYALAMPAALLASIALWHDARAALSEARRPVAVNLLLATYGFGVYAITQVFVHRLLFLPAAALNQDAFLSFTGLPIQALRAAAAVLIAVGLLRAMQVMEEERQSQLAAAQQARLTALEQRDSLRRDLLRHVVRSQEDERARIARELHDDISQQLTALSLELAALRTRLKRADTTQAADRLQDLARRMSRGLYQLVHDLRPSHLDHLGLVPALEFLVSEDFRPKGLEVSLETAGMPGALGGLLETALFRVAQESLNNVVRHANVSQARIELCCDGQHVIMRVCDQGCGFDAGQEFRPPRGWGLAGMRERVESLGGLLRVHSAPGAGTVVEAVIPLRDEQRKEAVDGTHHTSPRG